MNWAPFISRFANILTNKVYFLNKYTEFGMNYALVEGAELDVEDQVNVPARLSTLLANLNMALRWALAHTDPVINGAIRPMIEEAHSIYLSLTVVMADLLSKNDEPDIVQSTLARYEEERLALREIIMRAKVRQELNLFDDVLASCCCDVDSRNSCKESVRAASTTGSCSSSQDSGYLYVCWRQRYARRGRSG